MSVQNQCVICDKVFESRQNSIICPECSMIDRHVFNVIRDFLYDNPGANVNEVTNATGISTKKIMQYLREGRIETIGSATLINCEICGKPIRFGKVCEECERKESHAFSSAAKKPRTSGSTKMYTKNKKR